MPKAALAVLLLIPLLAFTRPATRVALGANPADSVEYVVSWPQAMSPYGPADSYVVAFAQGGDHRVDTVAGLADSFAIVKPAFGTTVYPFTVSVTPQYAGASGTPLTVTWSYARPSPAPAFPTGAVVTVDSSKVVRP